MNKSSLYKGCLEALVLRLLEGGRMYGYELSLQVKEMTKGELVITEGALYPLLHRLEAEELIQAESEMVGNRIRKYYSLTRKGKKEAQVSLKQLLSFMETLKTITNFKPA